MIRLPKRTASADSAQELGDDDLLEVDEPGESEQTAPTNLVAAAIADAEPPRPVPEAVPVGQVMASLEAEMSRALSDDKAAWVSRARSSAPPPSAGALPAIPSAPRLPAFAAEVPRAAAAAAPTAEPREAQEVSAPSAPTPAAERRESPGGEAPIPQVVVVREKPAFAWVVACLALGALGAVVGMRVASALSRDGAGAGVKPAPPTVTTAPISTAPTTTEALSAPAPASAPTAAVVSFDERDAVRVSRPRPVAPLSATEVLGLSPPPPSPPSSPSPSSVAPSAKTSAEGPAAPLVPDPPPRAAAPPPPPPKPARPKTPQEQLLEAQLKASER
ncbi:MAG: hypothetical protein IPF92_01415 [Myxococcales bacterium]|nr:hypothetical protein [Myxococcales bacterium]HQY64614.1 hypothetical protein [Polyangiaceae bacterium]